MKPATMKADTDHPVHDLVSSRWSPYSFDGRVVPDSDLRSVFEAARWAPSSYNEQPWHYIIARRQDEEPFSRLLSCLNEGNRLWARSASVLALGVTALKLKRNNQPNRSALHDLGLASATLLFEATARGLCVHQMIGILPDRARELYAVPPDYEILTGLAIGYPAGPEALPEQLREKDLARRPRRPLKAFLHGDAWNRVAAIVP